MGIFFSLIICGYILWRIEKLEHKINKVKEYYVKEIEYNVKVAKWLEELRSKTGQQ